MKAENMASKMYGNRFSQSEWEARVELAAAYRLVHHFGWIELIYNHISYQLPDRKDAYLINPYGLVQRGDRFESGPDRHRG
jgi:hypothetical protein